MGIPPELLSSEKQTQQDFTEPAPPSPSTYLDLPPTPRVDNAKDDLSYISRMLMEDDVVNTCTTNTPTTSSSVPSSPLPRSSPPMPPMLHGYVPEATYHVSDTYRIRIRVRYALDTYPRSIRFFIIFANVGYAVRYVSGLQIRPSHEQSGGRAT